MRAASAPATIRKLNNQAVDLAQAQLWKDASETITQILALAPSDAIMHWNSIFIEKKAQTRHLTLMANDPDLIVVVIGAHPKM